MAIFPTGVLHFILLFHTVIIIKDKKKFKMHIFASISLLVVASQYVDSLPSKLPESIGKSQTTPSSSTKFANNSSISMDGNNQYLDNIKKRLLDELDMETRPDRIPQDRQFPIGPKIEYNKQQLESDVESHPRIVFATLGKLDD